MRMPKEAEPLLIAALNGTTAGGGYEVASSGGTLNGATISGGIVELSSGAIAGSGTISFTSGGSLILDGTGAYSMLVAGFNNSAAVIDLPSVNFATASATFAEAGGNTSGTLTVTDGTHSASVLLMGNYTAGNFHLGQYGATGTLVYDPPVSDAKDLVTREVAASGDFLRDADFAGNGNLHFNARCEADA